MRNIPYRVTRLSATASAGILATTAAVAQGSGLQIYGTVDLAVGQHEVQRPGPPTAPIERNRGVHSGAVQTNYLGFRGNEDLGSGLQAKFQLEAFFRADTGEPGRFGPPGPPQDPFFSRSAWVGFAGRFGEMKFGQNTNPAWVAMVYTSAMGSNSMFSPSFRQQYNGSTRGYMGLDTGLPKSVSYTTPGLGGMTATLAVMTAEGRGTGDNVVGNAVYRSGPLLLAMAAAKTKHAPPPEAAAVQDQRVVMLGGAYDFKIVRLFAQYTDFNDALADLRVKTPHLGITAPVGVGQVQLAWARARSSGSSAATRTTTSLAYHHHLSRRSSLYGIASSDRLAVGTANSYVVGMRHTF